MRIFYRLFARLTGTVAGRVGKGLFKGLWSRIDEGEPPPPTKLDASLGKVLLGAALEAATMAAVAALSERLTASAFHYLFGVSLEPKDGDEERDEKR
jgi:Protein of unknown function (DUF4235)